MVATFSGGRDSRPGLRCLNRSHLSVGADIIAAVNDYQVPVRLVEWNVAMSLQTKTRLLAGFQPTIAVLPEAAHPDKTGPALAAVGARSLQWIGDNPNKGLLVAAFGEWTARMDDSYDAGYQWVMPVHLYGPGRIRMLAVWDMNHRGSGHESARRQGSCRAAMDHYADFLAGPCDLSIISGDFNNSVYWDKGKSTNRFGDFMDQLERRGYVSAYHFHQRCGRGVEPQPTLWWTRNADKPYHVDYTFVSRPDAVGHVHLGSHTDWLAHSDHSPMTVDLWVSRRGAAVSPVNARAIPPAAGPPAAEPTPVPRAAPPRSGQVHFDLGPGAVPDMVCGNDGVAFQQSFRPTHFTATWSSGELVEVRIWGPRVLQGGSLGKRLLDHCWRRRPIDIASLPRAVQVQLRPYGE